MHKLFLLIAVIFMSLSSMAQINFPGSLISVNGFRNPSIGLEYQYKQVSVHGGYYLTNFVSGVTTKFVKAGLTYWFLPLELSMDENNNNPSSFYVSTSYARGLNQEYEDKNAVIGEAGFRWFIWRGLNLRLGAAGLKANGESLKVNPTPGISYSFSF